MTQPMLELTGISKHFGEGESWVEALSDIDLSVRLGEVVALIGPSAPANRPCSRSPAPF